MTRMDSQIHCHAKSTAFQDFIAVGVGWYHITRTNFVEWLQHKIDSEKRRHMKGMHDWKNYISRSWMWPSAYQLNQEALVNKINQKATSCWSNFTNHQISWHLSHPSKVTQMKRFRGCSAKRELYAEWMWRSMEKETKMAKTRTPFRMNT